MATDEDRLRQLLKKLPLSEEAKGDVERIFRRSSYECMLCMINDYAPKPPPNPDHTH